MKSEQMPNYWELSPALQQQNARDFDHHYCKTDPAKLATTLESAVVTFFISSGYAPESQTKITNYVSRSRGIFIEQVKAFQAQAANTVLPEHSFSKLVKTFIHDYVITPTGIPNFGSSAEQAEKLGLAEAAPTDLDERMKLVEEVFAAMARELRTEAILRSSARYKPY